MIESDVALARLPQAEGPAKLRSVILLRQMPPYGDWLVCGVSSQLHHLVAGFDETIEPAHPDFAGSGLKCSSLIRLGFLVVLPAGKIQGSVGSISPGRHAGLLRKLSTHLVASPPR